MKPTTVRLLFSLAISSNWALHQLDIKNVFLHGDLEEDVYMWQPLDFVHPKFSHHVYKLTKFIYGVKQTPRAWYANLSCKLLSLGFHCPLSDTSRFIMRHTRDSLFILIYVYDIIVTRSRPSLILNFIVDLAADFSLRILDLHIIFLLLKFINIPLVYFYLRLSLSLIYCTKII